MELLAPWLPAIGGPPAVFAAAAPVLTFLATRAFYRHSMSARLHDRLLELNRLTLEHAATAADFEAMRHRATPFFGQAPAAQAAAAYQALRAYTWFRLNLYEEVFTATQGPLARHSGPGRAWRSYLRERLRHRLVRELFDQAPQQYGRRFAAFVRSC